MQIHLKKTNVELRAADEVVINQKILDLLSVFPKITEAFCEVGRLTNHHQKGKVYHAELDLRVPGGVIRVVEEGENLMPTFRQMIKVIKQRLIKFKETR